MSVEKIKNLIERINRKRSNHIIPFDGGTEILTNSKNEKKFWQVIDIWRDARSKGIKSFKDTNIILQKQFMMFGLIFQN